MSDTGRIPPAAQLLEDFVNSYEPQLDDESWSSAAALADWLHEHGLLPARTRLSAADVVTAVTVREGLRALLLDHAGHEAPAEPVGALNQILADRPMRVAFDTNGYTLAGATSRPLDVALGRLLDAVRECLVDGSWPRLKVCARDSCRWAFYDGSRNQARRWCSMAGCGNHVKMQRAYANRKARAVAAD